MGGVEGRQREHLIERGIKEGLFRQIDPRVAAEALLTSVLRMCEPDFTANSHTTTVEAVLQVYEIFWSGLFRGRRYRKQEQQLEKEGDRAVG